MSHTRALELIQRARERKATRLNLSNLNLTELPPEIGQLTELRVLWLHQNQLQHLTPEIGQLTDSPPTYTGDSVPSLPTARNDGIWH